MRPFLRPDPREEPPRWSGASRAEIRARFPRGVPPPYSGGGGTLQLTIDVLPDLPVAVTVASPLSVMCRSITPAAGLVFGVVSAGDDLSVPARTVVCTHGEMVTNLFDDLDCEKGGFWIVRRTGGTLQPVTYVAPRVLLPAAAVDDRWQARSARAGSSAQRDVRLVKWW